MSKTVSVRWLIRRDMPEVLPIERASFDSPWTEADFVDYLRQRNCIGMVALDSTDSVRGFMLYELHKDNLRLLNFAVHPDHRRQGVGRTLAGRLVGKLSQQKRKQIHILVRETNLTGQMFFSDMGFRAKAVVRGYYDDTDDDAYEFVYDLDDDFSPELLERNRLAEYFAEVENG